MVTGRTQTIQQSLKKLGQIVSSDSNRVNTNPKIAHGLSVTLIHMSTRTWGILGNFGMYPQFARNCVSRRNTASLIDNGEKWNYPPQSDLEN